jgi:hypothetical protein
MRNPFHVPRLIQRNPSTTRAMTILGASALLAACASTQQQMERSDGASTISASSNQESQLAAWPEKPRMTGQMLIRKYGRPDVAGSRMLVWYDKGSYKRIALARDEQPHNFPMPHTDYLAETVSYAVPLDKLNDVARYDGSVWFHRTRGELTAQCDKEEMNNLALNLAHDIATGHRSVEDARAFYARTAMAFMSGDRSNPYVTGIMFPQNRNAADPDMAMKM